MPSKSPAEIWRRWDAMEVRLSTPLTVRMLELARLEAGMRVLDLATGRGEPAIPAAHRVGPTGHVLGVDTSAELLALAAERAARERVANLELRACDAADIAISRERDAVLVRWGLMYMDRPVLALRAAAQSMKPGARLVAAVWAEPERVPYHALPRDVLARHHPIPPVDDDAPGVFRYAKLSSLERDLAAAGLGLEHVEELDVPVMEAVAVDDAIAWMLDFGMSRLLEPLEAELRRRWAEDIRVELEARRREGVIQLGGVTRIAVAVA